MLNVLYMLPYSNLKNGPQVIMRRLIRHASEDIKYKVVSFSLSKDPFLLNDSQIIKLHFSRMEGFFILPILFRLYQIIEENNPDIIVVDGSRGVTRYVGLVKLLFYIRRRPKVIFRFGNVASKEYSKQNFKEKLLNGIVAFLFRKSADFIICPSLFVKKDLVKHFKVPSKKIKYIYNPVDISLIQRLSSEKTEEAFYNENVFLVTIANLISRKGTEYLIKAVGLLTKEYPSFLLIIIGSGPLEQKLKNLVKNLGLEKNVKFLGRQDNPYKYLSRSFALVHPVLWEGLGIVLLEAMTCKIPIITTHCPGGIPEIIEDRINGLLVSPANPEALANAMILLLKDEELRRKLQYEGYKRVQSFSAKAITRQYENVFRQLVEGENYTEQAYSQSKTTKKKLF